MYYLLFISIIIKIYFFPNDRQSETKIFFLQFPHVARKVFEGWLGTKQNIIQAPPYEINHRRILIAAEAVYIHNFHKNLINRGKTDGGKTSSLKDIEGMSRDVT